MADGVLVVDSGSLMMVFCVSVCVCVCMCAAREDVSVVDVESRGVLKGGMIKKVGKDASNHFFARYLRRD